MSKSFDVSFRFSKASQVFSWLTMKTCPVFAATREGVQYSTVVQQSTMREGGRKSLCRHEGRREKKVDCCTCGLLPGEWQIILRPVPLSQIEPLQTNCQIAQFRTIRLVLSESKKPAAKTFSLTGKLGGRVRKIEKIPPSFFYRKLTNWQKIPTIVLISFIHRRLTSSSDAGCVWHGMCKACYLTIQPCKKLYKGVTRAVKSCIKARMLARSCIRLLKTQASSSGEMRFHLQQNSGFKTES